MLTEPLFQDRAQLAKQSMVLARIQEFQDWTLVPDVGALPSVSLRRGSGTEDANLELEIVVDELSNVATMDFVLRIPGELMRFEGAQAGPFLGLDASVVVTALSADQLQFLLTRAAPVGASGSDMALRLVFTGTAAGRGRIDFLGPEATTPGGIRIQGITWLGGNVEVSP
ncbi:MAG: hypothetical protein MI919_11890 [Holophagales bacterium]|nr:hypothetical protein [Holophagales bacterium]